MTNDDFRRCLIDEVRRREFLWNRDLPERKNRMSRENAWKEIAKSLQCYSQPSVADCKASFKNTRDQYNKMYQLYQRTGTVPNWIHFESMRFLDNHLYYRGKYLYNKAFAASVVKTEDSEATVNSDEDSTHKNDQSSYSLRARSSRLVKRRGSGAHQDYAADTVAATATANVTPCGRPQVVGTADNEFLDPGEFFQNFEIQQQNSTHMQMPSAAKRQSFPTHTKMSTNVYNDNNSNQPNQPQDDYITNFGISVAGQIRKLRQNLQSETMFQIQKILYEQEMKSQQQLGT